MFQAQVLQPPATEHFVKYAPLVPTAPVVLELHAGFAQPPEPLSAEPSTLSPCGTSSQQGRRRAGTLVSTHGRKQRLGSVGGVRLGLGCMGSRQCVLLVRWIRTAQGRYRARVLGALWELGPLGLELGRDRNALLVRATCFVPLQRAVSCYVCC